MCAYAIIPKSQREKTIIKNVNIVLSRERKPLSLQEIIRFFKDLQVDELRNVILSNPGNFEWYDDGECIVRQITRVAICETHCSKGKTCPGTIPFCSGLHICKFFLLSGKCQFGRQCTFGHDLTTSHNMKILKENFLDGISIDDLKYLFSQTESRTSVTAPRICKFYNAGSCRYTESSGKCCPNLHICKHYINSSCRFGQKCRKSHNLLDRNVKDILEKHGISTKRTPKEILADLRDAVSNVGSEGSSLGSYHMNSAMRELRLQSGNQHKDSSSEDDDTGINPLLIRGRLPKPPLPRDKQYQLPRETHSMVSTRLHRPASGQRQPSSQVTQRPPRPLSAHRMPPTGRPDLNREVSTDQTCRQLICFFYLRGRCAFGDSCRNFHGDLPYQWLYKLQGGNEWKTVPKDVNLEMELTYSDPKNQEYFMDIGESVKILFKSMVGTDVDKRKYNICRLSTSSSVEFERQPLTTVWEWYWKDQIGEWRKYGEVTDVGYASNISSTDLEQAYIANPDGQLQFNTLGHKYILDFARMVQCNIDYKTEREVSRRPVFVSVDDFKLKKSQPHKVHGQEVKGVASLVGLVSAPPHWQISGGEDIMDHYQIVQIRPNYPAMKKEYKEIEDLFCESMPSTVSIKSIDRIENGDLWFNYVSKKARMTKKSTNKDVGERRLFHGTSTGFVDAICKQGFDFRLSGQKSGTKYGKGSYFATTSKYSDCYTDTDNKVMFVVKVLVGEYIQGKSEYVRPPSKDKSNPCSDLYDSCVNDKNNPQIFVIFDNSGQVYPEYVIKYEYKYKI